MSQTQNRADKNKLLFQLNLKQEQLNEIIDHVDNNRAINAIKYVKEYAGIGLVEAKGVIDDYREDK